MFCLCSSKIGTRSQEIAAPPGSWEQTELLFIITIPCWSRAYSTFSFLVHKEPACCMNRDKIISRWAQSGKSQVGSKLPAPVIRSSCSSAGWGVVPFPSCSSCSPALLPKHSWRVSKSFLQQKRAPLQQPDKGSGQEVTATYGRLVLGFC